MKKCFIYISVAVTLAFCLWLAWRQFGSAPKLEERNPNGAGLTAATNAVQQSKAQEADFPRPAGIDDAGWRWLKMIRQLALSANQPIEFYARVTDQDGKPVGGAKLEITLTYTDEEMFKGTNFLHKKMGDEVLNKLFAIDSDPHGWIRLSGIKGQSLRVQSLSKDGYSWTMPQIGSFVYEQNNHHRVGYAKMRDAFDPNKGYVFQMEKIDEIGSAK